MHIVAGSDFFEVVCFSTHGADNALTAAPTALIGRLS